MTPLIFLPSLMHKQKQHLPEKGGRFDTRQIDVKKEDKSFFLVDMGITYYSPPISLIK